ncbi:MAG: segregation and condensation protein [Thermoanaerobaculia bacterium]|jgi:segregation and condensation protein A|nr:segregation and condensation protein [Thermoanaerobaculia bacterium]
MTTMAPMNDAEKEAVPAPQPADDRPPEEQEESGGALKVTLPSFHGPLDLLLHLIKQHKIDIYDIPIALVTEQYTAYLDAMEQLSLDVAADYIYMAALLIHIKSKMLLPHDDEAGAIEDPRQELVDRLIEYQRFKAVAESFSEVDVLRMGVWPRPSVPRPGTDATEIDMSEVGLFDLIDAFRSALNRYKQNHPQSIELRRMVHKISDKMRELYGKVQEKSPIRLQWFLEGRDRNELIALFLGTLELVRLGGISLQQSDNFGEILIAGTEKILDESVFAMFDNS